LISDLGPPPPPIDIAIRLLLCYELKRSLTVAARLFPGWRGALLLTLIGTASVLDLFGQQT